MGVNSLKTIESPVGAEIIVDGRKLINFGGSSYLGLSNNREILAAGFASLPESGSGYQFARHYQIATSAHQAVEAEAATFFNSEATLYVAGGYYFGLIAIAGVSHEFSAIFFDELAHHSLRDGIAASGLAAWAFRHLDPEDLENQLKRHLPANAKPLIVTDGLYSTLGEIAPLKDLAQVMAPYGGTLLVDESHSFGVLGTLGRGAAEHHDIPAASIIMGGSTSKALGVMGGIIPASKIRVAAFRSTPAGRGAAAGLPAAAAMCAASFKYVRQHPELLQRLRANIAHLKSGMRKIGFSVADDLAPVATFRTGSRGSMQSLQEQLLSEGIFVLHSNYVGTGAAGVIRCGIFADHTTEHLDRLLDALRGLN
jgi:8-amino-7-oxononanoate synthase